MRLLGGRVTLQLLSLAFAVVLWYAIAGQKTAERGLEVPVELLSVPRDLELTGDPVNTLAVRLRGSPGIIRAIEPGEVSAEIDLAGAAEGERIVHLTEASIRAPFGVKVVKISPSMLTLSFERTAERILPVRPRLIGRPAPGFEVADVTSQPAEVLVSGPRSRVQEIESAFTEPVSIDGADTTLVQSLAVGLEDPLLRLQGTSRVRVTARIREVQEQRSFDGLRVGARGGAARVEPATVRVVLSGPASVLRGLDRGDVEAYVTTGPDGAAARRVPVAVEIASGHAGVSVVETVPAEVTIRAPRTGGTR